MPRADARDRDQSWIWACSTGAVTRVSAPRSASQACTAASLASMAPSFWLGSWWTRQRARTWARRVSPRPGSLTSGPSERALGVAVGAAGHQDVGVAAEVGEPLHVLILAKRRVRGVELVVGDVADASSRVLEPVAQTVAGVAQEHRPHGHATDVVLALGEVTVLDVGGELPRGDREVHAVHLGRDQAARRDVAVAGAADLEAVALHVERYERTAAALMWSQ